MPQSTPASSFQLRVTRIQQETADVKTLFLARTDGLPLNYEPGQFITLHLTLNGQSIRRSYSLHGLPGGLPAISLKRYPNGRASRWLFDTVITNTTIEADGPHGFFTRTALPRPTAQLFLYAAGVGITPVYSLITDMLQHTKTPLVLFYSTRNRAETVFLEALEELSEQHPQQLKIHWFFSDHSSLRSARLTASNLELFLQESGQVPLQQTAHYLCGPPSYQFALRIALTRMGVSAERIRTEIFDPLPQPAGLVIPENESRKVQFVLRDSSYTVDVAPPQTLLRAASKAGIQLPYSCDSGRCGACAMRCTGGKVWMSNNEVLTESDLRAGLILSCTGHPIGDGVVLQMR